MKFNVVIVTDHSMSMKSVKKAAHADLRSLVQNLIDTESSTFETRVGHVGIASNGSQNVSTYPTSLKEFASSTIVGRYEAAGGCTPLWDAVDSAISMINSTSQNDDVNLVMVITDGADNASRRVYSESLDLTIKQLQASDRWTFLFRVPCGYRNYITRSLRSVPSDNIQEWETSERGMTEASIQTKSALTSFRSSVASGQSTSTNRFYANLDNVSAEQVKANLNDISKEVMIFAVAGQAGTQIRDFVNDRLRQFGAAYKAGAAFYQLTKPERAVQDYKIILVRDKTSKAIYSGRAARDLLGVPHSGNIALSPGRHGNYEIFIQSTSVNRKLDANTDLIYWADYNAPAKPASQVAAAAPVNPVIVDSMSMLKSNNKLAFAVNPVIQQARGIPSPAAKTVIKKPVAKKSARVRNRDTIETRLRRKIYEASNKVLSFKKTLNTTPLSDIGISPSASVLLALQVFSEYSISYSYSQCQLDFATAKTVGDLIKLLKNYGVKI